MALPVYRSSGARGASTTSLTVAAPSDHVTNDIELLQIESADDGAVTLSTANGFTQITGSPVSAANADLLIATRLTCFWRRWDGAAGNPVINDDVINHVFAQIHAFSGCITTGDPWNITVASSETVEDTTGSITGGTTTVDDCLIALLAVSAKPDAADGQRYSGQTNADLASLTERQDGSTNTGNGGAMSLTTGGKASAGAFGATTYTHTVVTYKAHLAVALKGVSATTFFQTIAATSAFTPALTASKIKVVALAATSTFTPAMTEVLIHVVTMAVTSTFTPTLTRIVTYLRTLAVASTFTPTLTRVVTYLRTLAVTSAFTPALTRVVTYLRTLAVASTFTAALTRVATYLRTLAVTSVFTPAIATALTVVRTLSATSTFVAAMTQQFIAGTSRRVWMGFRSFIVRLRFWRF